MIIWTDETFRRTVTRASEARHLRRLRIEGFMGFWLTIAATTLVGAAVRGMM